MKVCDLEIKIIIANICLAKIISLYQHIYIPGMLNNNVKISPSLLVQYRENKSLTSKKKFGFNNNKDEIVNSLT